MKGLLLAAGKGSRLLNNLGGDSTYKPLVQVCGKPLIDFSVDLFEKANINEIIAVVDCENEIKNYLTNKFSNISVSYEVQTEPVGIVNAIMCAVNSLNGDDVLLQLSDEIFINPRIGDFLKFFVENDVDFVVSFTESSDVSGIKGNYSILVDSNGLLVEVKEKPSIVTNNKKGTGICIFSGKCLRFLSQVYDYNSNTPRELCDFINLLIKAGYNGKCFCIAEEEINVNTPKDLKYALEIYEMVKENP